MEHPQPYTPSVDPNTVLIVLPEVTKVIFVPDVYRLTG